MNTALAPKSIALSIKRVMSTKLNLSAAVRSRPMLQCQKENPELGEAQGFTSIDGVSGPGTPSYCRSRVLINWRMPPRCFSSERHQQKLLGEMIHFQERRGCGGIVPSGVHSCGGYGGDDACINRKRGTKPAEESDSIWLLAWWRRRR